MIFLFLWGFFFFINSLVHNLLGKSLMFFDNFPLETLSRISPELSKNFLLQIFFRMLLIWNFSRNFVKLFRDIPKAFQELVDVVSLSCLPRIPAMLPKTPRTVWALLRWSPRMCPLVSLSLGMINYSLSQHICILSYSFRELSKVQYGRKNAKRSPEIFLLSTLVIPVIGYGRKIIKRENITFFLYFTSY